MIEQNEYESMRTMNWRYRLGVGIHRRGMQLYSADTGPDQQTHYPCHAIGTEFWLLLGAPIDERDVEQEAFIRFCELIERVGPHPDALRALHGGYDLATDMEVCAAVRAPAEPSCKGDIGIAHPHVRMGPESLVIIPKVNCSK